MKNREEKDTGIFRRAIGKIQKHPVLSVGFFWTLMLLIFLQSWKSLRPYFFKTDYTNYEFMMEKLPVASDGYLRIPIPGKRNAYSSLQATQNAKHPKLKQIVRDAKGSRLEFGLVRIGSRYSAPCEYVLRVYELGELGEKRKLLDVSADFVQNNWMLFHPDTVCEGRKDGTVEIQYEMEPKSIKERIGLLMRRDKEKLYYKDFVFAVPHVLPRRKPEELNVILISLDTLRSDHLGFLGYPRQTTPQIDSFIHKSILFPQAITSAPWTTASHWSMFSGLYPSSTGGRVAEKLMAEIFHENGYYTIAFTAGIGVSGSMGFSRGFNRYMEFSDIGGRDGELARSEHEDTTREISESAMQWLEANRDLKFFMFLHNYECHDPYEDEHFLAGANEGSFIEQRIALYDGDIRRADAFFGLLIAKLEALDLLSKTIIIVFSDHGEEFYDHFTEQDRIPQLPITPTPETSNVDHGHSVYEELIKVPLIFYIPEFQPKENVLQNQVRLIDMLPTILDLSGIEYNGTVQGMSLVPLIMTGERAEDPPAMSEEMWFGPEQKSIRMNGYKYIFTENPEEKRKGVSFPNIPQYALFNLKDDPEEKINIHEQNPDIALIYHEKLEEILEESHAIRDGLRSNQEATMDDSDNLPKDVIDSLKALGYLQ